MKEYIRGSTKMPNLDELSLCQYTFPIVIFQSLIGHMVLVLSALPRSVP